ncbi:MAG: DNA alkylation repair protein [Candidatus Gastranaerophilaceae bacterium]
MEILEEIKSLADEKQALHLGRFFKTGAGEYGEGDLFLGIKVPVIRSVAKKHYKLVSLKEIQELIKNPYHEVRLLSLMLMVFIYENTELKKEIFELYLKNVQYINNWDLVDLSAPKVVGNFVYENKIPDQIYDLANSNHLWSERISVVSTHYFIKRGDFALILELSEKFLTHKHDLIHKACGWMLREMGKVDEKPLYGFLDKHSKTMPRTMLRYSIERLPKEKREYYMK